MQIGDGRVEDPHRFEMEWPKLSDKVLIRTALLNSRQYSFKELGDLNSVQHALSLGLPPKHSEDVLME